MGLVIVLLLIIIIYHVQFAGWQGCYEDYLTIENAKAMRGLFAVVIILHHLCQQLNAQDILGSFRSVGFWGVSIFFFYSGYGLMTSILTRSNYLQTFWVNRLPKIIIPFVGMNAIYLIAHNIIDNRQYDLSEIISYLLGFKLINANGWYIVVILLFYLAFYVLFKFFKPITATMGMLLVILLYISTCYWLEKDTWLYNSCLAFFVGMLWSINREKILALFSHHYMLKWGLAFIMFYAAFLADKQLQNPSQLHLFLAQTGLSMLFVICVISAQIKLKIGNPALLFLGKISMEIYLVQHLILDLLRSQMIYIASNTIYVFACLFGSILSAFILNKIFGKILALWSGRN